MASASTFEPVYIKKYNGPLIVHSKRWYFRLVKGQECNGYKRARALMDDFDLNQLAKHMVVCYTPTKIPGRTTPFVTAQGDPIRIFAFFDSYIEFYNYMQKFPLQDRNFYEIIFGEFPQKPHFDIDISKEAFDSMYPGEDMFTVAEIVREAVITACIEVFKEMNVEINLAKDLLIYSSHADDKRSYHLVITNKCHDGNKEAKAFYTAVLHKVGLITNNKYLKFIDSGVYSPRQQFRLIGCQKNGSNRPKIFYEIFTYNNVEYQHIYPEDVSDISIKKFTVLYESLVSFTSGCCYLPSLIPEKPANQLNLSMLSDVSMEVAEKCFAMLQEKMPYCPFSISKIQGHLILLKRLAPSHCPICKQTLPHAKEHPFLFVIDNKVYWDCRRSHEYADNKKLFVGYLHLFNNLSESKETLVEEDTLDDDSEFDELLEDLGIIPSTSTISPPPNSPLTSPPSSPKNLSEPLSKDLSIYQRTQNVEEAVKQMSANWSSNRKKKYGPKKFEGLNIPWSSGL